MRAVLNFIKVGRNLASCPINCAPQVIHHDCPATGRDLQSVALSQSISRAGYYDYLVFK
jgi:hypothetical protein